MTVRCVVVGYDQFCNPGFYPVNVVCTVDEYKEAEHIGLAADAAKAKGWHGQMVVFDTEEIPSWLYDNLKWVDYYYSELVLRSEATHDHS